MAHPPNPPSGQSAGANNPTTTMIRKTSLSGRGGGGSGGRNARFGRDGIFDPRGKQLIDEALAWFDSYPDCPFGDSHPWAMELGMYYLLVYSLLLYSLFRIYPFSIFNISRSSQYTLTTQHPPPYQCTLSIHSLTTLPTSQSKSCFVPPTITITHPNLSITHI